MLIPELLQQKEAGAPLLSAGGGRGRENDSQSLNVSRVGQQRAPWCIAPRTLGASPQMRQVYCYFYY